MKKFTDVLIKFAGKLDRNKYLKNIKDSLLTFIPLMVIGSLSSVVATVLKTNATLAPYATIFSNVNFACVSCVTIGLVFLIGYLMARANKINVLQGALTSFAAYITIVPHFANANIGGEIATVNNILTSNTLGAQYMLIGLVVGILSVEMLTKLLSIDKIKIKMPDNVPPMIAASFNSLIPMAITIVVISIVGYAFLALSGQYLPDLFYSIIQKPLEGLVQSPVGALVIVLVTNLLWFFGVHGGMATRAIRAPFLMAALAGNIAAVEAGLTPTNFFTETFWGCFVVFGGSGFTLALLVDILWFSKRKDYREIAKLGFIPAVLGINEPVVYGLPIVLNPILGVPFIIAPLVTTLIGYFASMTGFIPCSVVEMPLGLPVFVNAFVGFVGSWQAMVTVILCFIVAMAIYAPFIFAANRQLEEETNNG